LREAALAVAAEATDRLKADLIECLNPTAPIGRGCGPIFSDRKIAARFPDGLPATGPVQGSAGL